MILDFFAGCLGGCAGIVVGYPMDTVKVHMQTQDCRNPKYRGTWHCLRTIIARDSMNGLYKGMTSPIAGVAVVNAIVFGVYGHTQRNLSEPDRLSACFLAGASAGLAQTPVSSPIELAKTRLQLQSQSQGGSRIAQGPLQCLRSIYRREGCRGVFKGLGITFLREGPSYGVYFLTFEMLSRTESGQPISTPRMLMAGGLAGTASWVISYPIDVIKSRIQAETSNRYAGAWDCLRKSVRAEGYTCLYRGLNSTIIRAFPTNAATFAVVTWTFRLFGEQPNEAPKTEEIGATSARRTKDLRTTSKGRESFASKWHAFFDGISKDNNALAVPSYSALSTLSIGGLMPDNHACLVHNCRRSGCKHGAPRNTPEDREKRKRRSRSDEVEEGECLDERKADWDQVETTLSACTCNLQRVFDIPKLDNT